MKPLLLIFSVLLLSGCWPAYRQLDSNNNPISTAPIVLRDCRIDMYLQKKYSGDDGDYHVVLVVTPLNKDLQLKVSDISVNLSDESDKVYQPGTIRFLRNFNEDEPYVKWRPGRAPVVTNTSVLTLKLGNHYSLIYSFSGRHHQILKLDLAIAINGEKVKQTRTFKKYTEVELIH